jgi:hypothetical protein
MQRRTHRNAGRTAALAAVLLCGVALVPPIAGAAGLGGTAVGNESVTAAKWGVTASVTTMTFTTTADQTSTVTNNGTVALVAESYSVTVSNPTGGSPTFKVFQCAVAWSGNLCSGTAGTQVGGTLAKNSTTTITSTTAMAVSGLLYLQVEPTGVTASTVVTISTKIAAPSQLRAAVKTNQ